MLITKWHSKWHSDVRPPLHPPNVHSPSILFVGGQRLHVSRLLPIIARDSIHPVYHGGHCVCVYVCVFVCVCYCLLPHPPLCSPVVHSPLI